MIVRHLKLDGINGSLVTLNGVKEAANEEIVELHLQDGTVRTGRVVKIDGEEVTVQVFEGTRGVSMENTATVFTGKPMEVALSPEILGRVFDGLGRPIDGLGPVYPVENAMSTVRRLTRCRVNIRETSFRPVFLQLTHSPR